jgi:carbonic anhydrase/acetyltransferase-like protein (isoleucine patch superfamily)
MSSEEREAAAHDESLARARSFPMRVRAHASAFVAPGAVVVGEVSLGERASVWFGAVLRGDMDAIHLGDESNVQDNSVIHVDHGSPAIVGRRVVIGHRAIVHGAEVEDGCLIGMGSVLLTGSHIGAGSLVAAGALVSEGKRIPPRSLVVGVPGRVVGEVSPEMTAAISRGADHYVALARTYRERGIASPLPPADGTSNGGIVPPDALEVARILGAIVADPDFVQQLAALRAARPERAEG